MNEKVLKCLFDIQAAIQEIETFLPAEGITLTQYKDNLILKRAVERNLEIIGEAMNRILNEDDEFPVEDAYRIVGLRNQIIHGYDAVSDDIIWAVLVNHLPKLRREIKALTSEFT